MQEQDTRTNTHSDSLSSDFIFSVCFVLSFWFTYFKRICYGIRLCQGQLFNTFVIRALFFAYEKSLHSTQFAYFKDMISLFEE